MAAAGQLLCASATVTAVDPSGRAAQQVTSLGATDRRPPALLGSYPHLVQNSFANLSDAVDVAETVRH